MRRWLAWELARNDKSLVGFWPLMENMNDYSGNGYHLSGYAETQSLQGVAKTAGQRSHRLADSFYNPYNQLVSSTAGAMRCWFQATDIFTVMGWICADDLGKQRNRLTIASCIIPVNDANASYYGYWGIGWELALYEGGATAGGSSQALGFYAGDLSYPSSLSNSSYLAWGPLVNTLLDGLRWVHVALVFDGSAGGYNGSYGQERIRLFVNGREQLVEQNYSQGWSNDWTGSPPFWPVVSVGCSPVDIGAVTGGAVRCVRIYSRRLSQTEIIDVMRREANAERFVTNSPFPDPSIYTFKLNASMPLATIGGGPSASIPLFVSGPPHTAINATTLYVGGQSNVGSGIPLTIPGPSASGVAAIPLFVLGPTPVSGSFSVNLTVLGPSPSPASGQTPLYIFGSTPGTSGLLATTPLFVSVGATGSPASGSVNLALAGPTTLPDSNNMNMFVAGTAFTQNNIMPLAIYNGQSGTINALPLVMNAPSGTPGSLPASGAMNLFLGGTPGAVADTSMFTWGSAPTSGNLPFYVYGNQNSNASMSLVLPSTVGQAPGTTTFYTHGY